MSIYIYIMCGNTSVRCTLVFRLAMACRIAQNAPEPIWSRYSIYRRKREKRDYACTIHAQKHAQGYICVYTTLPEI